MIKITGFLFKEDEEKTFEEYLREERRRETRAEHDSLVECVWSVHEWDEAVFYDLEEQVYKKRKLYYHISNKLYKKIDAYPFPGYRSVPAAFFAMDAKTVIEFYRYKFKGFTTAYLHRCINNRMMNLFNPESDSDVDSLNLGVSDRSKFLDELRPDTSGGKNTRYWEVLEKDYVMKMIYSRTKCDGIALDYYAQGITSKDDRTEGFCLFKRGLDAMPVIDIARLDDIYRCPDIDPKKLEFKKPWEFDVS